MTAPTAVPPTAPLAMACADPMPLDPAVLCRRPDGHSGTHQSDGGSAWADTDEPADPDRRTP
jgi:hypothetical protein